MSLLARRQPATCPQGKAWYVCAKRNFHGCCSVDPCSTGLCPDSEPAGSGAGKDGSSSSTTTPSPTTPPVSTSTTTKTAADGGASVVTVTATPTISPSASSTDSSPTSSTAVSGPETGSISTSGSGSGSNQTALIGGLVGGIAGGLLILGLLLFLCRRRRRRRDRSPAGDRKFTLLRWNGFSPGGEKAGGSSSRSDDGSTSPTTCPRDERNDDTPNTGTTNTNTTTAFLQTPTSAPFDANSVTAVPSSSLGLGPGIGLGVGLGYTPELPDTGFYRQRAELATHSQSELINVPAERRQPPPYSYPQGQAGVQVAGTCPGQMVGEKERGGQQVSPPVVTDDGVVLGANLGSAQYSGPEKI